MRLADHEAVVGGDGDGQGAELNGDVVVAGLGVVVQGVGELVVAGADIQLAAGDVVGCALALNEAGHGHGVVGQSSAVVDLLVVRGDHEDIALGDFQSAVHRLSEGVVVGHFDLAAHDLVGGHNVVDGADVGDGAFHDRGQHIAFHQDFLSEGVAVVGQGGAVIDLFAAVGGDGDDSLDGLDHQGAVDDHELHVGKVDVVVGEVSGLQLHRIGADIGRGHAVVAVEGEVCDSVQRIADAGYFVTSNSLLGAVVGELAAVLGDGDNNFIGQSGDSQGAEHDGDFVVLRLGALVQSVGEGIVAGADGGLSAGHVVGRALALNEAGHGHGVVGQSGAVVDLAVGRGGHGDCTLGDFQSAVDGSAEGVVGGHVSLAAHDLVRGHDIGDGADVGDGAFHDCDQLVAFHQDFLSEGVAVVGQGGAVIDLFAAVGGDGDDSLDGLDHQGAVDDHELHVGKVDVVVGEVSGLQLHRIGADIGCGHAVVAAEGEVSLGVQRIADAGYFVTGNSLLGAVVGELAAVFGDGHDNLVVHRSDGQGAVDDHEGDLGKVLVDVGEVLGLQLHRIGADGGAGHNRIAAEGEVLNLVQFVGDGGHIVAFDLLLGAVVLELAAVLGDGDNNRFRHGSDGQGAVHDHEGDVGKVLVDVLEVLRLQLHRIGADGGAGHAVVAAEGEVVHSVQRIADRHVIAGHGMLVAIVLNRIAVLGDGDNNLIGQLGDGQGAELDGDGVVVRLGTLIQSVSEGILAVANLGLSAGHVVGRALALSEAVFGNGNGAVGQCGAVVNLLRSTGGQGDFTLGDFQSAVHDHELDVAEVLADVGEVSRLQFHCVGARVGALHGRVAAEGEVRLGVQRIADAGHNVTGNGLLSAVVHELAAVLRDGHGDLVGQLGDGQGAFDSGDVVVSSLGALVQSVGEGIVAGTNLGLSAGHVIGRALALSEAVAGNGNGAVGQSGAVVDLLVIRGGHGDCTLGDFQSAVHDHELDVAEVLADVGEVSRLQFHCVGARVGALHGRVAAEGEVRLGVQRIADAGHNVTGNGLLSAVVHELAAVLRDGHGDLVGQLGDGQGAFDSGDDVVVSLGALIQSVSEGILAVANLGLSAGHVIGRALAISEAVAGDGNGAVGQSLAVVDLLVSSRGQGDCTLGDFQSAVDGSAEGVVGGHVGLAAHDLVGGHNIVDGADVGDGAFHNCGQHIAFHQNVLGVGVAVVGQGSAVIGLAVRGSSDDDLGRNGSDRQAAVGHNKLHIGEILAVVDEALAGQAHGILADVGADCLGLNILSQAEVGLGVQLIADSDGLVALDGLLSAVVDLGSGVALDDNLDLVGHGGDGQIAVDHLDGDVGVVDGGSDEVRCLEAHRIGADVLAAGDGGSALNQSNLNGCGSVVSEALDRLSLSVVDLGSVVAGDGNSQLFGDGGDGQVAVHNFDLDGLVVGGDGGEVLGGQAHHVGACIDALSVVRALIDQGDGHICGSIVSPAVDFLLGSVVNNGLGLAGDGDGQLGGLGDDQLAGGLGDGEVGGDVLFALQDHDLAGERAGVGARSGALCGIGQAGVAELLCQIVFNAGDFLLGSIVDHGLGLAGEGHGAGIDHQICAGVNDVVVLAFVVDDGGAALQGAGIGTDIGALAVDSNGLSILRIELGNGHGLGRSVVNGHLDSRELMLVAVVGQGLVDQSDGDRAVLGPVAGEVHIRNGHGELAVGNLSVLGLPAVEGVAVLERLGLDRHILSAGDDLLVRRSSHILRNRAGELVGDGELGDIIVDLHDERIAAVIDLDDDVGGSALEVGVTVDGLDMILRADAVANLQHNLLALGQIGVLGVVFLGLRTGDLLEQMLDLNGCSLVGIIIEDNDILLGVGAESQSLDVLLGEVAFDGDGLLDDALDLGGSLNGLAVSNLGGGAGDVVVNSVVHGSNLGVPEDDDIFFTLGESDGLLESIHAVALEVFVVDGVGLAIHEDFVGNSLAVSQLGLGALEHILDGIGHGQLIPVSNEGDVVGDGLAVVEGLAILGVPANEGMTGIRRLFHGSQFGGDGLVLLGIDRAVGGLAVVVVVQRNNAGGSLELRVQNDVVRRHLVEHILLTDALGIVVPAGEGVILVHFGFIRSGSPVVSRGVDVLLKADAGDGIQLGGTGVVLDVESLTIVIEVLMGNTIDGLVLLQGSRLGEAINILLIVVTAVTNRILRIDRRIGIVIIICILQHIMQTILIATIPLTIVTRNSTCVSTPDHICSQIQTLGCIGRSLTIAKVNNPSIEVVIIFIIKDEITLGRPLGRDILTKACGEGILVGAAIVVVRLIAISIVANFQRRGTIIDVELQRVDIQVVQRLDDGRAVGLDFNILGADVRIEMIVCGVRQFRRSEAAGLGNCGYRAADSRVVDDDGGNVIVVGQLLAVLSLVHDGVAGLARSPLGVNGGVAVESHGGRSGLRALSIQIPTAKDITGAGGSRIVGAAGSGINRHILAVLGDDGSNVAAVLRIILQDSNAAVVVNLTDCGVVRLDFNLRSGSEGQVLEHAVLLGLGQNLCACAALEGLGGNQSGLAARIQRVGIVLNGIGCIGAGEHDGVFHVSFQIGGSHLDAGLFGIQKLKAVLDLLLDRDGGHDLIFLVQRAVGAHDGGSDGIAGLVLIEHSHGVNAHGLELRLGGDGRVDHSCIRDLGLAVKPAKEDAAFLDGLFRDDRVLAILDNLLGVLVFADHEGDLRILGAFDDIDRAHNASCQSVHRHGLNQQKH